MSKLVSLLSEEKFPYYDTIQIGGSLREVVSNLLECDIAEREFEL